MSPFFRMTRLLQVRFPIPMRGNEMYTAYRLPRFIASFRSP